MFEFTEQDYKAFKVVARQTQEQLSRTSQLVLEKYYEKDKIEICQGNIIAHGTIPIALVAHMDTVFLAPPTEIFYDREEQVIWSPHGLGADDRAGIYGIYYLLKQGYRPTILFMRDEEDCCAGAYELTGIMTKLENINYMIELDRAHHNDCVFYDVANEQFQAYIESFGFHTAIGSYTDIRILSHYWKICSVNLSIGYEYEHTAYEYLKVNSFMNTLSAVAQMLSEPIVPKFEYIEQHYPHDFTTTTDFCCFCGTKLPARALDKIVTETGTWNICDTCITNYGMNVDICEHCFNYFIPADKETVCLNCKNKEREDFAYAVDTRVDRDHGHFCF